MSELLCLSFTMDRFSIRDVRLWVRLGGNRDSTGSHPTAFPMNLRCRLLSVGNKSEAGRRLKFWKYCPEWMILQA